MHLVDQFARRSWILAVSLVLLAACGGSSNQPDVMVDAIDDAAREAIEDAPVPDVPMDVVANDVVADVIDLVPDLLDTSDIDNDVCISNCMGMACGVDPMCGQSCGACDDGFKCNDIGICVPDGMALISTGPFWMGCNIAVDSQCSEGETPYHEVTLSGYFMDKMEVTVVKYGECVTAGVCTLPTANYSTCNWSMAGREEHPVNCVDWNQSKAYCEWVGKRLPTEAEWEKGARSIDGRKFPWGNETATCDYAVMDDGGGFGCGTGFSMPVCSKSPAGDSPYGLCDMSGNIWEWVSDWYDLVYYSSSPDTDPVGPESGPFRVTRGGSFYYNDSTNRTSNRGGYAESFSDSAVGFRCARPLESLNRLPTVSFLAPGEGSTVSGPMTVRVLAADDVGLDGVDFMVDAVVVGQFASDGKYEWTPSYQKSGHVLKAVARDSVGQTADAQVSVNVDWPLTVDVQSCVVGACAGIGEMQEVFGTIQLRGIARDDGGAVSTVELFIDGTSVGSAATVPFDFTWDSGNVADGEHVIRMSGSGMDGATGYGLVTVVVNNCDRDHDTYLSKTPACGGTDCDDNDAAIHPCADDLPGDGKDSNCDGFDVASCDDCNACSQDTFVTGACLHVLIGEGQACDDKDACTVGEKCQGGKCQAGNSVSCSDSNPCTTDACDTVFGCLYQPGNDGTVCALGTCWQGTCCANQCQGKDCGDNGCGGSCGTCPEGKTCDVNGACSSVAIVSVMVPVPAGSFMQGCNSAVDTQCYSGENPYHLVNVPLFDVDKYEVTVAAYKSCVDAGTCSAPRDTTYSPYCYWGVVGKEEHPVNCIDWNQAGAYCTWAGKRLCSESEWEKAARGTDGRIYPWGNQPATCSYAVMSEGGDGCGTDSTMAVGSKPSGASPYGAMDMAGNVWDWVADDFHSSYTGAPSDGSAWVDNPRASARVARGGSFYTAVAGDLRGSSRNFYDPSYSRYYFRLGARCCRSR